MIKYFQKLKAKKGFTLVELIVVIAIIGVLAAILIPTMLGYVTQSKVTSANTTASSIKNEINAFLTQMDTANKGMKKGSVYAVMTFAKADNADWTCALDATTNFNDASNWSASAEAATTKGDANHNKALAADIKDLFPEIKIGAIQAYLTGGQCAGILYINGEDAIPTAVSNDFSSWAGDWPASAKWSSDTQGIEASGAIVGTAPVIALDSAATTDFTA